MYEEVDREECAVYVWTNEHKNAILMASAI